MIEKTRLGGPSAVAQTKNSYRYSHFGLRVSESFCYQFTAIDEASLGTRPCVRPYSQRCHPHREERGRQERNLQLCSDRR